MQRGFCAAFGLLESGTAAGCLRRDRGSPRGLRALHRICRKSSQDRGTVPALPPRRIARTPRNAGEGAARRHLSEDASCQGDDIATRGMKFDEELSRKVEAVYLTPDVVAQRGRVLQALALAAGEHVLDIGVGPGLLSRAMASAVGREGRVCGIDLSRAMLAMAAK